MKGVGEHGRQTGVQHTGAILIPRPALGPALGP